MRLDKYLCKSTDLTKLEAVERIHNGEVSVNGEVVLNKSTQRGLTFICNTIYLLP